MSRLVLSVFAFLVTASVWAQESPAREQFPVTRGFPFTDYTAGAVIVILLVGFLVAILLIGGFLVLNLGMMSKRAEDRVGRHSPSEVGILKSTRFPDEPFEKRVLPAEDEEEAA